MEYKVFIDGSVCRRTQTQFLLEKNKNKDRKHDNFLSSYPVLILLPTSLENDMFSYCKIIQIWRSVETIRIFRTPCVNVVLDIRFLFVFMDHS